MISASAGLVGLLAELLAAIGMAVAVGAAGVRAVRRRRQLRHAAAVAVARPLLLATITDGSGAGLAANALSPRVARCLDSLAVALAAKVRGRDRGVLTEFLRHRGTLRQARQRTRSMLSIRRLRAVELLGALALPECRPELEERLRDRNSDVRRAAVRALGRSGGADAVPALLRLLDTTDRRVPEHCVTLALTRCGPDAVPALTAALGEAGPRARRAAAQVLGWLGATTAVEPLCLLLDGTAPVPVPLRVDAIGALGRIGAPQAAVPLRSGLAVGQPASVRIAAATALGRLDDVASVPSLAAALRAEHEPARAAAAALAQLGPSGWKALELAAPGSAEAREALAGVPAARSSP